MKNVRGESLEAKAKYVVEGERSKKFFFNLEKNRQKANLIKEVVDENGEKKQGTEEILSTVKLFYEDMFKGRGTDKKEEEICLNQIKVKVLEEDNVLCEAEISEDEIELAIRQLTTGKSPGIDGLTN